MTPCFFCVICLSICTVCQDMPVEAIVPSSSHNSSTSGTIMQGCGFCGRFFVSILFFDFCIVFSLFFVSMCKQGVYMQKSPKTGLCFFGQSFLQNIAPIIQLVMPPHKNKVAKMPSIFVTKGLPASC